MCLKFFRHSDSIIPDPEFKGSRSLSVTWFLGYADIDHVLRKQVRSEGHLPAAVPFLSGLSHHVSETGYLSPYHSHHDSEQWHLLLSTVCSCYDKHTEESYVFKPFTDRIKICKLKIALLTFRQHIIIMDQFSCLTDILASLQDIFLICLDF